MRWALLEGRCEHLQGQGRAVGRGSMKPDVTKINVVQGDTFAVYILFRAV
jgi:hypothetical protein